MGKKLTKSKLNFQNVIEKNKDNKAAFAKISKYESHSNDLHTSIEFTLDVLLYRVLADEDAIPTKFNSDLESFLKSEHKPSFDLFSKTLKNLKKWSIEEVSDYHQKDSRNDVKKIIEFITAEKLFLDGDLLLQLLNVIYAAPTDHSYKKAGWLSYIYTPKDPLYSKTNILNDIPYEIRQTTSVFTKALVDPVSFVNPKKLDSISKIYETILDMDSRNLDKEESEIYEFFATVVTSTAGYFKYLFTNVVNMVDLSFVINVIDSFTKKTSKDKEESEISVTDAAFEEHVDSIFQTEIDQLIATGKTACFSHAVTLQHTLTNCYIYSYQWEEILEECKKVETNLEKSINFCNTVFDMETGNDQEILDMLKQAQKITFNLGEEPFSTRQNIMDRFLLPQNDNTSEDIIDRSDNDEQEICPVGDTEPTLSAIGDKEVIYHEMTIIEYLMD